VVLATPSGIGTSLARPITALRVLVVGQTPPPYGGQAVMIQTMLTGEYKNIEMIHVRLAFSGQMADVGRLHPRKVLLLLFVIVRIMVVRWRSKATVLYYAPSGPDRVPMYRDLCVLLTTRWMFEKTVFHFHAGGVSELYPTLSRWIRPLFRRAYFKADLGIRLSRLAPPDPTVLCARQEAVVPNGIGDYTVGRDDAGLRDLGNPSTILFVGVLRESKGLLVLIDACRRLRAAGLEFRLELMGSFASAGFEMMLSSAVHGAGLDERVRFLGVRTGEAKWQTSARADILCFPSFFESETFGLVLLEAMQFGLPIVSTRWRGIPDIVRDVKNGFLVPVRDAAATADRLATLLRNPDLAREMGAYGRALYRSKYTVDHFHQNIERVFGLMDPRPGVIPPQPEGL
jgi:glycosyltransferase involved in cell wall biosynthesis